MTLTDVSLAQRERFVLHMSSSQRELNDEIQHSSENVRIGELPASFEAFPGLKVVSFLKLRVGWGEKQTFRFEVDVSR